MFESAFGKGIGNSICIDIGISNATMLKSTPAVSTLALVFESASTLAYPCVSMSELVFESALILASASLLWPLA